MTDVVRDPEEFLAHYGVPGMKWGKHKKSTADTKSTKPSLDHQVAASLKSKHVSELNNTELKFLTQRMQLEKQYKDLSTTTKSGKKAVDKVLAGGDKVNKVIKFLDSPAGKVTKGVLSATLKTTGWIILGATATAGGAAAASAASPAVRQLAINAAPAVRQLAIGR